MKWHLQSHQKYFLYTFFAQKLYNLVKSSPLKWKFVRFLSTLVNICQILHVNFELTGPFLFKIYIILYCHNSYVSWKFKLTHFLIWIKGSCQSPNFETFEWFVENLPNSSCHFCRNTFISVQILH